MIDRIPYSYAILRYIHDISTGEFVNVGVVVMSSNSNYLKFLFRKTPGRISDIFPGLNPKNFKSIIATLERRCNDVAKAWMTPLQLTENEGSLSKLLNSILPKDDSAFVWSNASGGISRNLDDTLRSIYEKYAGKYDRTNKKKSGRTDDDVWHAVKKTLEARSLLPFFEEKVIHGKHDDVKFPFAWKNGIWHCIEPISLDLKASESIRDKAHKCLGEIVGVSDSLDNFKVYFVVGEPSDNNLIPAYERAMGLLQTIPHTEVFTETTAENLFDQLSQQISTHE